MPCWHYLLSGALLCVICATGLLHLVMVGRWAALTWGHLLLVTHGVFC